MSNASQFIGGTKRVASIINKYSSGGVALSSASFTSLDNVKSLAASGLVANTLQTALSITGGGTLQFIAAGCINNTARSIRLKITIDGRVIFDAASASGVYPGVIGIGGICTTTATPLQILFQPIPFTKSALVEIASSLTESVGINTYVNYEVNA